MVEVVQSLIELAFFLLRAALFAIPLTIAVIAFSRLEEGISKKFKLSWVKASALSTFIAAFIAILIIYLIPFFGVLDSSLNDSLPSQITTQIIEENGQLVEVPADSNPIADSAIALIITFFRLAFVSAVIALLLIPLELLASSVFSRLARKKSANLPAFYLATLAGFLIAALIILLFPWIPAGIAYFIYFS